MKNRTTLLAEQMKEGKLGKGLTLKRRLGDDFEEVIRACQVVPTSEEAGVVESKPKAKKAHERPPEDSEE